MPFELGFLLVGCSYGCGIFRKCNIIYASHSSPVVVNECTGKKELLNLHGSCLLGVCSWNVVETVFVVVFVFLYEEVAVMNINLLDIFIKKFFYYVYIKY